MTPWVIAIDPIRNPLPDLIEAALVANTGHPSQRKELQRLLASPDAVLRWWGVVGLWHLGSQAAPMEAELRRALREVCWEVRLAAADALRAIG